VPWWLCLKARVTKATGLLQATRGRGGSRRFAAAVEVLVDDGKVG
jgi:hypothetical protein